MGDRWGVLAAAVLAIVAIGSAVPQAEAQVTSSTDYRAYRVRGTTAEAVVNYMKRNPFKGDRGAAFANIRPDYRLQLETVTRGGMCRAAKVGVHVHFAITLPEARDEARMSRRVGRAWRSFVNFAEQHEAHHRRSYLSCARKFVAEAMRERAASCGKLRSNIRALLNSAKRQCEAAQVPFDRSESRKVLGLSLFSMARSRGGRR